MPERERIVDIGTELPAIELELTATTTALQVSGSQDWHRIHHDPEVASAAGHESIFYNTGWTQGMLSRLLTDWIGDSPWWLESLTFQMRAMNAPGDSVRVAGRISDRETADDGVERLTLEVWIANARVGVTTPGTAVVRLALPGRAPATEN
jgi:acyl dehydratase